MTKTEGKENPMTTDDTVPATLRARNALAELFFEALQITDNPTFESFEDEAIRIGHAAIAEAMASALERLNTEICSSLPAGVHVHDHRTRTLATKVGDVCFCWTRVRDKEGFSEIPLAEALDLPHGCRISPAATAFLVSAGAEVSYAKAAHLLFAAGGSQVSPTAVMCALHSAGELCAKQDEAAACSLYQDGVLPEGSKECSELCLEADGTWFSVQKPREGEPKRLEVKAVVAYSGKEKRGSKTRRVGVTRHAMVGSPSEFMSQAVATIGKRYDLSKIRRVHVGADGEMWCLHAGEWFPSSEPVAHLDPFHINRAVLSCFYDQKVGRRVLDVVNDGDTKEACCLIEACAELGLARSKRSSQVVSYLRGNIDSIAIEGPSLGTMESENQHIYGVRMDSFPCAWSPAGASAMARIRSRLYSGRKIPRMTRARSETPYRRARREQRELHLLKSQGLAAGQVVEFAGKGWEVPHRASVAHMSAEVRFAAGVDRGMVGIG